MKKIVLTGGGSAGHVTPNLALVPELRRRGYEVYYIGSYDGIEKSIVEGEGIPYTGISSGKLRRYFSWKNFTDPARVQKGFHEAKKYLKKLQPDIVFSKGGFVSTPVVGAAHALKIPVILHESDLTPGLANKLGFRSASACLCSFPETLAYLPKGKSFVSGCPIRAELAQGSREKGLSFAGIPGKKPVLLAMGGSLGSVALNTHLRAILPQLLEHFEIIHLCGKEHLDESLAQPGYAQFEYVSEEMKDLFAAADILLSRAGANAICEFLFLKKPNLLVPLPLSASRGDQILNARSFEKQGFSKVMEEETITDEGLLAALLSLYDKRAEYISAMEKSAQSDAVRFICDKIDGMTR